jgi:hypothetical protein
MPRSPGAGPRGPTWAFLTNHARVLVRFAADPAARMRYVAADIGITERAVRGIIAELADGGYLTVSRTGARDRYAVHRGKPLRHPLASHRTAGELIDLAGRVETKRAGGSSRRP